MVTPFNVPAVAVDPAALSWWPFGLLVLAVLLYGGLFAFLCVVWWTIWSMLNYKEPESRHRFVHVGWHCTSCNAHFDGVSIPMDDRVCHGPTGHACPLEPTYA